jgi:hypothetical protein
VTKHVDTGFLLEPIELAISTLLPSSKLSEGIKATPRYETIAASVREVGIIEPLIVYPEKGMKGAYVVLDGHVRLEILKDLGIANVTCLVAKDDENYTYNHHVNRIAPIQEIRMIRKAVAAGVSEERIAKALNLKTRTIQRNAIRLKGICNEAIEMLKDKPIPEVALSVLRKVKPYRQIEIADLMVRTGCYSASYARTMLMRTPKDQLLPGTGRPKGLRAEDLLETVSRTSEREFVLATESHGKNVMDLMLVRTYMKKLLDNTRVARFLVQKKPDLLRELQQMVEATSLEA